MTIELTKAFLKKAYVRQRLSTWAIEKKFGISRSRVHTSLKRHGIPTRSLAQSHVRYARADFSGDLCEKAYLVGFAIGDLRVRNHGGKRSETISIACGSTKLAQIRLIRTLFAKYGRVWEGRPDKRGAVNIEAFVNKSFSFLLPDKRSYTWCRKSRELFFSFLAGFTDAEGSFFVSNGKAHIAWGNYNVNILAFIRSGLMRFGIEAPNMHCDSLRGYIGRDGYARRKNYCHVTCVKKDVVRELIVKLRPYVRHGDKRDGLVRLHKNLIMRNTRV